MGGCATDGGMPRVPAGLADARGRFIQFTQELAALSNLVGIELSAMALPEVQAAVASLARDERTLRKIPRLNELGAGFDRAGLDPLMAELQTRRPDPDDGRRDPRHVLVPLDHRADRIRGSGHRHLPRRPAGQHRGHLPRRPTPTTSPTPSTGFVGPRPSGWWPRATSTTTRARSSQAQAARKRGHLPLRQLFAAAPDVMTALKPCWAMSPLVVSQLLPGDRPYFDVVVFDEASQIVPADAIPAILRAHRVVVAGDRHQLPPTNFFSSATDGDEDEADAINADGSINLALTSGYESILDVLTAGSGRRAFAVADVALPQPRRTADRVLERVGL